LIQSTSKCKIKKDITSNGYWLDSVDGIIKRCVRPCRLCDTTGSTCIQCFNNYYMSAPGMCSKCSLECTTCVSLATQCTSCHMGYQLDTVANKCNAVCERYEYLDTVSGECMLCPYPCGSCHSSAIFTCITCIPGFYLDIPNSCKPCHNKCSLCTGPSLSQCQNCHGAFKLIAGTC